MHIFLISSFLVALAPVALLGVSTHTTESERFLYLPSVFLCCWVVMLVVGIQRSVQRIIAGGGIALLCFCGYTNAVRPFHLASQWNRSAVSAMASIQPAAKVIVAENLPQHYKGGYMFRLGFPDAMHWLANDHGKDTIIVKSTMIVDEAKPLKVVNNVLPQSKVDTIHLRWSQDSLYIY